MKIKITTLALFMFCILIHGNAQQKTDGFFSYRYYSNQDGRASYLTPNVGLYQFYGVGIDYMEMNTETVSVGSGLFALMAMSTSYLALRRKEDKR